MDAASEFKINLLQVQNRELRERNSALEIRLAKVELMVADADELPYGLPPLSKMETQFLKLLIARQTVSDDMAMTAFYADRANPPGRKVLDVFICHLRRKLKPYKISIDRQWGVGWTLSPASRNAIKHMKERH